MYRFIFPCDKLYLKTSMLVRVGGIKESSDSHNLVANKSKLGQYVRTKSIYLQKSDNQDVGNIDHGPHIDTMQVALGSFSEFTNCEMYKLKHKNCYNRCLASLTRR